ncbi:MAG: histidine--tRNA ligase [Candidatus Diapherotrites archaeon]|nr:histidine--tRNA ligase [Candidatus Diapherotrites archaeon]
MADGKEIQTVRGMRDLVGKDAVLEEFIESTLRKVFVSYGYEPLYTPAVENFDLFKIKGGAGEAIKDEIYYFKDKSERELGLRFEFTASTARVVATNQIKMPYKRYQIGEVYRYDRPQAKRYRAFIQADIDIFGVKGLEAELEIMLVLKDCFLALNLKPRVIMNSRKLLQSLLEKYAGGKEIEAMRVLDKLDKFPEAEIRNMLEEKEINSKVLGVIVRNSFEEIESIVGAENEGVIEVKNFLKRTKDAGIDFIEFDSRLARGLEYYTGIVFEAKIENGPSVMGGGRYDKLVGLYGGQETFVTGYAIGVSRLFDYLKEKGFNVGMKGIYLFGINVEGKELTRVAQDLREKKVFVEIDLNSRNAGKNIEYAQKKGYKFVGIIGENELKANKITLKNLESGKQEMIGLLEIEKIKKEVMG